MHVCVCVLFCLKFSVFSCRFKFWKEQLFVQGGCDGIIREAESVGHLKGTLRALNILSVATPMCCYLFI